MRRHETRCDEMRCCTEQHPNISESSRGERESEDVEEDERRGDAKENESDERMKIDAA
jgi:hypothetical protein